MKTNFFKNKVCWITGASSGIGAALAHALDSMGASLILSARDQYKLDMIKMHCASPEKIFVLPCDMEAKDTLPEVAVRAWNAFEGIDYVFLNAGMAVRDLIIHTDMVMFEKVMNINFLGNVAISRELIPLMQKKGGGCFVVTNSLSGKFGIPKLAAYSASKHALHGFFDSLRAEYEKDGIRVTMITAGLVKTNITLHALQGNGSLYGKMQESVAAGIAPETCALSMLKAVSRGKSEALVGGLEIYSVWVKRFIPSLLRMAISRHPMRRLRNAGILKG